MRQHIMVECRQVGELGTNCYIITNKDTMRAVVIDPGAEGHVIRDILSAKGMTLDAILLTHGHYDHIGGVDTLKTSFNGVKVYAHEKERSTLTDTNINLSGSFGNPCSVQVDRYVSDMEQEEIAGIHFRFIHTPGHTPGGMCIYAFADEVIFVGDTLFAGSVGRTDFPGGDGNELLTSIRERLADIPDFIKVYPGHGPSTTMEIERAENPYM